MTEVGEGVAVVAAYIAEDKKCEYDAQIPKWNCNLDGDGGRLAVNLTKHCGIPKPTVPVKLDDVSYTSWPSQAHHLIPWQQLRKHAVTQWLKESPPEVGGKVLKDTNYDVDHGNNGKFMPYASDLPEWDGATAARKQQIVEKVMSMAGIQLHQGPHSYKSYGVGENGYKTRVKEYLDRINALSLDHINVTKCPDCKAKSNGDKVPPRKNTTRYLDAASGRLEVDINLGRIYVSRRAATFAAGGGVTG